VIKTAHPVPVLPGLSSLRSRGLLAWVPSRCAEQVSGLTVPRSCLGLSPLSPCAALLPQSCSPRAAPPELDTVPGRTRPSRKPPGYLGTIRARHRLMAGKCSSKAPQLQRTAPTPSDRQRLLGCVNDLHRPACTSMVRRRSRHAAPPSCPSLPRDQVILIDASWTEKRSVSISSPYRLHMVCTRIT
jgi:hypothetical protein